MAARCIFFSSQAGDWLGGDDRSERERERNPSKPVPQVYVAQVSVPFNIGPIQIALLFGSL